MDVCCQPPILPDGYQPRKADQTILYQILQEHLEPFLAQADHRGIRLPYFVRRELRSFMGCGDVSGGFLRVRCPDCRYEMALPFSCKGRGFCPSCGGRHMSQTAVHLVDEVLPDDIPYRQWVLTLPFDLRFPVAFDPEIQNAVLRVFHKALSSWQREAAFELGVEEAYTGAVTVIQRYGSALQLLPHLHTISPDGVFYHSSNGDYLEFLELPPPTQEELADLLRSLAYRVRLSLRRRGLLLPPSRQEEGEVVDTESLSLSEPAMAACYQAAIRGRSAFGPERGHDPERIGAVQGGSDGGARPVLKAREQGFDLHPNVRIDAGQRLSLERLCRYLARPPISNDRLSRLPDGRVSVRLKTPFRDGTTHLAMTPFAFIERLCALIPRPRTHRVRYHGVFAPASTLRRLVVPVVEEEQTERTEMPVRAPATSLESPTSRPDPGASPGAESVACVESVPSLEEAVARPESLPAPMEGDQEQAKKAEAKRSTGAQGEGRFSNRRRVRWNLWSELVRRVFGVDCLECPNCYGNMRVIAVIMKAEVVNAILSSLREKNLEAPSMRPARSPPEGEEFHEDRLIEVDLY